MQRFWSSAVQKHIVVNACRIALVVGTVLNLINQGDAILAGQGISWGHITMNYLVPYCVATYSAVKNELNRRGGT
jgi:hypothetical protein